MPIDYEAFNKMLRNPETCEIIKNQRRTEAAAENICSGYMNQVNKAYK